MTMRASAMEMLAAVALSSAAAGCASDLSALGSAGRPIIIGRDDGNNESIVAQGLKEPALP
jgi:hypothetical protein